MIDRRLLPTSGVLLLVLVSAAGCGGSGGSQDMGPRPDGSPDAPTDAPTDGGDGNVVDPFAGICAPCVTDAQCTEGLRCTEYRGTHFCGLPCNELAPLCPDTFQCTNPFDPDVEETICVPRGPQCCIDADGDGYGVGMSCLGPDCNDASPAVHPGVVEICGNGRDDDCNGVSDEMVDEACDDAADNDCDTIADCADTDCNGLACGPDDAVCMQTMCGCASSESVCTDGVDADCDGMTDCADPDCAGLSCGANGLVCSGMACACPGVAAEMGGSLCANSMDDDCDGLIDCADPNCLNQQCANNNRRCNDQGNCGCPGGNTTEVSCDNSVDDDCDGRRDCQDPECSGRTCDADGLVCTGTTCTCPGGATETECTLRVDDDCDGLVDCEDPDCDGLVCGTGASVCNAGACACGGTFELCDGDDDDCNDVVDNGCPSGLTLGTPIPQGSAFGGSGGSSFDRPCAAGKVLVGYDGRADESGSNQSVHRLTPVCATVSIVTTPGSPESSYGTQLSAVATLTPVGGTGGVSWSERCPNVNHVVIGIQGNAGEHPSGSIGTEVERFGFICGALTIARSGGPGSPWQVTVVRTQNSDLHPPNADDTQAFTYVCPTNQVATATYGRAGGRIDAVAISCSPVTLQTL